MSLIFLISTYVQSLCQAHIQSLCETGDSFSGATMHFISFQIMILHEYEYNLILCRTLQRNPLKRPSQQILYPSLLQLLVCQHWLIMSLLEAFQIQTPMVHGSLKRNPQYLDTKWVQSQ